MQSKIRFVAIIGRNNSPLYIQHYDGSKDDTPTQELRYHFISHMALDYVETQLSVTETSRDYALLLVHDGIAVYGCLTNTGAKFFIGTDAHENAKFDLRGTMRALQKAYISYVCNPFREQTSEETPIESKQFDSTIKKIVEEWNSS